MQKADFDPAKLRIDKGTVDKWISNSQDKTSTSPRPAYKGKFLRGPVPLDWLRRAAELPGCALAVGLALWFLHGCMNQPTVKLTRQTLELFGVKRQAGYLGLKNLEKSGLIRADRHPGRCPIVTILSLESMGGLRQE